MKIYTKTGDAGETGLYGGQRVPKDAVRIQSLGAVDELNAALGVALTNIDDSTIRSALLRIQGELFELGADLATPRERGETVPRIQPTETARLEAEIDEWESALPALRRFILPGGSAGGASLHFARAVCRRAERQLVALACIEDINPEVGRYINRLSDHLFVLARFANQRASVPDTEWTRPDRNNPTEGE